jgi:prevent-host-death family protein
MTKMIGAAEFKAKCLAILDEVQASGESITITKRGKPVATVSAVAEKTAPVARFGMMKGSVTWAPGVDPTAPVDPDWEAEWDANNPAELYR